MCSAAAGVAVCRLVLLLALLKVMKSWAGCLKWVLLRLWLLLVLVAAAVLRCCRRVWQGTTAGHKAAWEGGRGGAQAQHTAGHCAEQLLGRGSVSKDFICRLMKRPRGFGAWVISNATRDGADAAT